MISPPNCRLVWIFLGSYLEWTRPQLGSELNLLLVRLRSGNASMNVLAQCALVHLIVWPQSAQTRWLLEEPKPSAVLQELT